MSFLVLGVEVVLVPAGDVRPEIVCLREGFPTARIVRRGAVADCEKRFMP